MFDFIKFSKKTEGITIFNCRSGVIKKIDTSPYFVDANLELCSPRDAIAQFICDSNGAVLISVIEGKEVDFNGELLSGSVEVGEISTLRIGENLFYLTIFPQRAESFANIDISNWIIFSAETGQIEDEAPLDKIKNRILSRGLGGAGLAICPRNFDVGFYFSNVFGSGGANVASAPVLAESVVATTCPLCWLKFDLGDATSVATHESLRGDPVLGPDEMLRFLPTCFNEDGVPLDEMGMPAPDIACPHCGKRLPQNFLDYEQKIFSIVGAPSSGKSYYLSVLINQLQTQLYKHFGVTMKDLDPTGNMLLTQMKNRLFSAKRSEDAILAKTALEGAMYERHPRFGKMVSLPKPMTYALSDSDDGQKISLVFYDNAGEHFEPGFNIEDSPGAMHVASSSALFFLFDPAANVNFKNALSDYPDPQLSIYGRLDQQDTILSEMEVRIKRIRSLDSKKRIDTPLAIIIGKCDMWKHLLREPLPELISEGMLNLSALERSSEILRRFLLEFAPNVVAVADGISTNTRYFAVSALGHSPQVIESGYCAGKIAPVVGKLAPIDIELPTIWALSQCTNLIKTKK